MIGGFSRGFGLVLKIAGDKILSGPFEILCFCLLHNFRTRYPYVNSCFLGPLRALRMRFHDFLAWQNFLFDGVK